MTERSAVPFLPVNPEYSATRNQVRQNGDTPIRSELFRRYTADDDIDYIYIVEVKDSSSNVEQEYKCNPLVFFSLSRTCFSFLTCVSSRY